MGILILLGFATQVPQFLTHCFFTSLGGERECSTSFLFKETKCKHLLSAL